jgi:hypothetical protein
MGGTGSGNHYHWWRLPKKNLVENCRSLDGNVWTRQGILKAGVCHAGRWAWFRDEARTERTASLGYEVCTLDPGDAWLRLTYTLTQTQQDVDYRVRLSGTQPRFGGLRWWFHCPLTVNGVACGRRVGKLYLQGRYFGCRHCHDLTYRSAQQHDSRVDFLRRNPEALLALLDDPKARGLGRLVLALKALDPDWF